MACLRPDEIIERREGLASEEEVRAQEEHMAGCEPCRELSRSLAALSRLLPHAWHGEPPMATGPCPSPGELVDFLHGQSTDPAATADHAAGCRDCVAQLAAMQAGRDEPVTEPAEKIGALVARARALGQPAVAGGRREPRIARGWRWALATAAAAVLVVVNLESPVNDGVAPEATGVVPLPTELRAPSGSVATEPTLLEPADGASVGPGQLVVRWLTVVGATKYQVTVLDRAGEIVWEGETAQASVELPASVSLDPGGRYFVGVEASLQSGETIRAPSIAFEVEVATP